MVLPWNPLLLYARWREKYLQEHPEKRLFPWLEGGLRQVSETWEEAVEEAGPLIKPGPKFWILLLVGGVLLLASNSE